MKIYMVAYEDYDGSDEVGYFLEKSKAQECCRYLNRYKPSFYKKDSGLDTWYVYEYEFNDTDYALLNKELDEQEMLNSEMEFEMEKQEAIAEIARLQAKYGL